MNQIEQVFKAMTTYYARDVRRINHFVKVWGFAKQIGTMEGVDAATMEIIEIVALTHDIGIKMSEIKYGNANGNHQQVEGVPEAKKMLEALAMNENVVERVCWLIAHHHTYDNIVGIDYQILVEADFLVNFYEDNMTIGAIKSVRDKIFKTKSGLYLLNLLYLQEY